MVYWGVLGEKWWRNYLHTHSFYEICYVFEGLTRKLLLDTARAVVGNSVAGEQPTPVPHSEAEAITQTAVRYLRDNFGRPIQIRDVAAQVYLSERHLSRLFHQVTGTTLLDVLVSLRLDAASQKLLDREIPIKTIARSVGYPDVHYFTT